MAKLFASEVGNEAVENCFRIHGGYGYSRRSSASTATRRLLPIGEGTCEIQRMAIGKKLLQRQRR